MKSIRKWLEEDAGITLAINSLTSYVSRIRRREKAGRYPEAPAGQFVHSQTESIWVSPAARAAPMPRVADGPAPKQSDDPLAQAMRVLSRPKMDIRKIHNDGDPQGRNLI
jgi:hypothetical protein